MATQSNTELTYDTKTIITVVALVTVYPVGVVLMFVWMDTWPSWVKILVCVPFILVSAILLLFLVGLIIAANPGTSSMTSILLPFLG